ncbi:adenosine kinase [Halosquirtibacter xylanolyticus]|uniref:adenosine kinase n=1 Tax=Halosquirtibacter xylanolyticus TaxID=3374599 RepID=UPI00374954EA|nr:adenosine kinase [Prolixibacteraceae bacterium]
MNQKKQSKVIGIGNALVDEITLLMDPSVLQKFNLAKGSMTLVDRVESEVIHQETKNNSKKITSGGSVSNVVGALASLGIETGFIGSIGEDELGSFFIDSLSSIDVSLFLKESAAMTGVAISLVTPDGERTFATHLGAAALLEAEDLKKDFFDGFDIFMIEGYLVQNHSLIIEAARMAHDLGLKVAIDLASFNVVTENLELLTSLVCDYVDIVFANEEEARAFVGKEPREALDCIASMVDMAVVKIGAEGAYVSQEGQCYHVPTLSNHVVDTTGAGDFFAAGFLYGLSQGYELERCGYIGSLLASKVIAVTGAHLEDNMWGQLKEELSAL